MFIKLTCPVAECGASVPGIIVRPRGGMLFARTCYRWHMLRIELTEDRKAIKAVTQHFFATK